MESLLKYLALALLGGLTGVAEAQPRCPTVEDIEIMIAPPPTQGTVISLRPYPSVGMAVWDVTSIQQFRINLHLHLSEGSFGIPSYSMLLDPLPPGNYQLVISPNRYFDDQDQPCPQLALPLTIAGTPNAAVPAPLFSLPGLLLLMGLFGLLGWTALRRH